MARRWVDHIRAARPRADRDVAKDGGSGAVSLLRRVATTLSAKADQLLDRYEDPCDAIDYAFELLLEQLEGVSRAATDLATAQQHVAIQSGQLEQYASVLQTQAREAARLGRDDLAREALARGHVMKSGAASLIAEGNELADEEEQFISIARLLEKKVPVLQSRKEGAKASYAVTGAKAEIDEAVSDIRDEVATVSVAMHRVEAMAAQLRAQAASIDALLASGAVSDLNSSPESIDAELRQARASADIARDLASIKMALRGG